MERERNMRRARRKKRSFRRIRFVAVLFVAALVAVIGCYAAFHRGLYKGGADGKDAITHIMIMGVDRRSDDIGRSDTLMVASIDAAQEKAALLSIPRDTRVAIEGNGYDKINHAYAFGGHALTQKSVENLLGVTMDHYILIDTKAFARIIDAMGGIDINVQKRMYYEDPWDDDGGLVIDFYPGEQHLDGKKAMEYVRYRDGEGDIGRIGRQQAFMKAVLAKLISTDMLPRLPQLVEEVRSTIETDMTVAELLDFAKIMKGVQANGMTAQMVPGSPGFHEDISYWIPDITDVRDLLASEMGLPRSEAEEEQAQKDEDAYFAALPKDLKVIAQKSKGGTSLGEAPADEEKPMKPEEISVMVINSSGINGAGAQVASVLQKKGFIISGVETGKTSSREQTTITTSTRNTDVFYGMPFPCIIMDGGSSNQAVVNIGLDYRQGKSRNKPSK